MAFRDEEGSPVVHIERHDVSFAKNGQYDDVSAIDLYSPGVHDGHHYHPERLNPK
jgi:hypothetical protein